MFYRIPEQYVETNKNKILLSHSRFILFRVFYSDNKGLRHDKQSKHLKSAQFKVDK